MPDLRPIRGIVFDLDGTLIDSYGAIAESLNHARRGFELPPLAEHEVRLRVGSAGEDRIALEVIDKGPGLPDGELEKMFAPFYTTKQSGAGLGLAVSRSIAEEHGGSLVGRNADGGGAVFRLELDAWKE